MIRTTTKDGYEKTIKQFERLKRDLTHLTWDVRTLLIIEKQTHIVLDKMKADKEARKKR